MVKATRETASADACRCFEISDTFFRICRGHNRALSLPAASAYERSARMQAVLRMQVGGKAKLFFVFQQSPHVPGADRPAHPAFAASTRKRTLHSRVALVTARAGWVQNSRWCSRNRWVQAMAAQGQTGPGSKKGAMNSIILDSNLIRYGIRCLDMSDGARTAIESFAGTAHSFPGW